MQEFDPYYSNSMGMADPLWLPPLIDDDPGFPAAFLADEHEQLLLDLNAFLSDPPPLHSASTNFAPPPDNYLFQQFPLPDFQLPYLTDYPPPPKRLKCCFPDFLPPPVFQPPPPPPQVVKVQSCCCNGGDVRKRKEPGGAPATRQSLAARERRKRITDKTVELGKLIPGAESGKMNTAEMLQHAFKYVKFMQSQLSLLQLLPQEGTKDENLQIVASRAVQEKLYMNDKCLVPIDLVDQLAEDGDLKQLKQSIAAQNV